MIGQLSGVGVSIAVLGLIMVLGFLVSWERGRHTPQLDKSFEVPSPLSFTEKPTLARKKVLLVIDDAGYRLDQLENFLSLPFPMAVAVLPFLPNSQRSLEMVLRAGKVAMLHMPMQPLGGLDPGEGALMLHDSPEEIRQKLARAIDSLPGIVGVNNHMGSWFTSARDKMRIVLDELSARGLFFLDSYTSSKSQAGRLGEGYAMRVLQRDVFLDHETKLSFYDWALNQALDHLKTKDYVVLIGHVQSPGLVEKLRQFYQNHSHELDFVFPADLLK